MYRKKGERPQNWPLIKNPQFFLNHYETWSKLPTHKVVTLTNFHGDRMKIVDSLLLVNFCACLLFFCTPSSAKVVGFFVMANHINCLLSHAPPSIFREKIIFTVMGTSVLTKPILC